MASFGPPPRLTSAPKVYDAQIVDLTLHSLWLWLNKLAAHEAAQIQLSTAIRTATGPTIVVLLTDSLILVDASASDVSVILPDPALSRGQEFSIKRITEEANTVTIAGVSGNIDNSATASISFLNVCLTFTSDGTDYWIR